MVKRICVLYPDGSINALSSGRGEQHALNEARDEARRYNKGEKDRSQLALVGEVEVDLMSFKERC